MSWEPPGPGVWWFTRDHFPVPVSRLFAEIFPPTVIGWQRAAARYGWPIESITFSAVGPWLYYSPGSTDWEATVALEPVAEHTLAARTWRDEIDRWHHDERPAVVARNLALQNEDLGALGDLELAAHIERAIRHFDLVAPLHFEHSGFDLAVGLLLRACAEWGIDAADATALLAGASPATAAAATQVDSIAGGLSAMPATLDDVRAVAGRELDDLLHEHGWRVIDGNDLAGPTLGERPNLLLAAIRSRMERGPRAAEPDIASIRDRVSPPEREQFTELLADARGLYALRDDDNGICFVWPLGLIRRGVLDAGRRLAERGALHDPHDLFDATPDEIDALLGSAGPSADELRARHASRSAARDIHPPSQLGETSEAASLPLPPHVAELAAIRNAYFAATSTPARGAMEGLGIGTEVVRGPARLLVSDDAIDRVEPGDVLIAVTTTCNLNSVFPMLAGVATEEGGLFSHTALLSRELAIPAVVGAPGLLAAITDGDLVEIDAAAGVVRVIERA
jgi:pyruvate,water dikinase